MTTAGAGRRRIARSPAPVPFLSQSLVLAPLRGEWKVDLMTSKVVIAIVTVLIGIGAALALYWLLNKLAELLPAKVEHKVKPFLYILPAYFAIAVFLIYPTIHVGHQQLQGPELHGVGRVRELHRAADQQGLPADDLQHPALDADRARS